MRPWTSGPLPDWPLDNLVGVGPSQLPSSRLGEECYLSLGRQFIDLVKDGRVDLGNYR